MKEYLKMWLMDSMGLIVDSTWNNKLVASLVPRILYYYDLIQLDEFNNMLASEELTISDLLIIQRAMETVNIEMTLEELQQCTQDPGETALALLYELYYALKPKNYWLLEKQLYQVTEKTKSRFNVKVLSSMSDSNFDWCSSYKYEPFTKNKEYIVWYVEKLTSLKESVKQSRNKYLEAARQRRRLEKQAVIKAVSKGDGDSSEIDFKKTYEELYEEQENLFDVKSSKKTVKKLNKKQILIKEQEKRSMVSKTQGDIWNIVLEDQNRHFDEMFQAKMRKTSSYETQMQTRLNSVIVDEDILVSQKTRLDSFFQSMKSKLNTERDIENNRIENTEKIRVDDEDARNRQLHLRLYALKFEMKAARNYNMCLSVVSDLVSLATTFVDFKDCYKQELTPFHLKNTAYLFIKSKPIYPVIENVSSTLDFPNLVFTDDDKEIEDAYMEETARQDCMNSMCFEDYCAMKWPWIGDEVDDPKVLALGTNICGHIAHRVLSAKYPDPPMKLPPDIPKVSVAICINGLHDLKYVKILRRLLKSSKIEVIQLQDAINYCLDIFKAEVKKDYLDTALVKATESVLITRRKQNASFSRCSKENCSQGESTQTPKVFPCEALALSQPAKLGKEAFEALNVGVSPKDQLVAAMFVEYLVQLKRTDEINGWVLINYPQTVQQALQLEVALTSVRPHHFDAEQDSQDCVSEVIDVVERMHTAGDKYNSFVSKKSQLLQNPATKIIPTYSSYLTAFVDLRCSGSNVDEQYYNAFKSFTNDDKLNRYYSARNCSVLVYYEQLNFETIKDLAKIVLEFDGRGEKESVELFTDTVLYLEAEEMEGAGKGSSTKIIKILGTATGNKVSSYGRSRQDNVLEHSLKSKSDNSLQQTTKPGDDLWSYVDLPVPAELLIVLANIWEAMETSYIKHFKEMIFSKRTLKHSIEPYCFYVVNNANDFITHPDDRQRLLNEFRRKFNDIDDDMRDDLEVKEELHARVKDFEADLLEKCHKRLEENESERRNIINNNWTSNLLYEICNLHIALMKLETDRCADTMQVLMDYYTGMIAQQPSFNPRLRRLVLTLIEAPSTQGSDAHLSDYVEYCRDLFINVNQVYDANNIPFIGIINSNVAAAEACINQNAAVAKEAHQKLLKLVDPSINDTNNILEELQIACDAEVVRCRHRIRMIRSTLLEDIRDILERVGKYFRRMYDSVQDRFNIEVESVKMCISVFQAAIEAEMKLVAHPYFANDKFYVVRAPEEENSIRDNASSEEDIPDRFTMRQLHRIVDYFLEIAPTGSMPLTIFTFALLDIITYDVEDGSKCMVPKSWLRLSTEPQKIQHFCHELFGKTNIINWKDFIVYNLDVTFPTIDDLMSTAEYFYTVDLDNSGLLSVETFISAPLWYEHARNNTYEQHLTKELFVKMYSIKGSMVNYVMFLLDYCKSVNPLTGVSKALSIIKNEYCVHVFASQPQCQNCPKHKSEKKVELQDIVQSQESTELIKDDSFKALPMLSMSPEAIIAYLKSMETMDQPEARYEESVEFKTCEEAVPSKSIATIRQMTSPNFFIDLDILLNLLATMIPWEMTTPKKNHITLADLIITVYKDVQGKEEHGVFASIFFTHKLIVEAFSDIYKFARKEPTVLLEKLFNMH